MKAHSIEWTNLESRESAFAALRLTRLDRALTIAGRLFVALVPALAIVVASAWLVTMTELTVYLQATIWASGFVFLGLAIDARGFADFVVRFATGLALPVLAWLSSVAAAEFLIVAAAMVAAWIAVGLFRLR
jgi:hypothetical protein